MNARKRESEPVKRASKKPRVQAQAKPPKRRPVKKKTKQNIQKKNIKVENEPQEVVRLDEQIKQIGQFMGLRLFVVQPEEQ